MQDFKEQSERNFQMLKENAYPGRGIVLGMDSQSKHYIQVYWIMGRSENSRNRIFVEENGFVKTKAYDENKCTDPSFIIYYPVKHIGSCHIVTNGDQTDTVYERIKEKKTLNRRLWKEPSNGQTEFYPSYFRFDRLKRSSFCIQAVRFKDGQ